MPSQTYRRLGIAACLLLLLTVLVVPGPAQAQLTPRLQRIYLAPLGDLPDLDLPALTKYYADHYGLQIQVLPPLDPGVPQYDATRRQFIAEELIVQMELGYRGPGLDPQALLIGLTDQDMYIRSL